MSCKEAFLEKLREAGLEPMVAEDGTVGVGIVGENCPQMLITVDFDEDQYHWVHLFAPKFIRVWSKSAIGNALCNTCNKEYVGVKFTMGEEDYISAHLDGMLGKTPDVDLAFHLFEILLAVVDDAYEYMEENM